MFQVCMATSAERHQKIKCRRRGAGSLTHGNPVFWNISLLNKYNVYNTIIATFGISNVTFSSFYKTNYLILFPFEI